MSFFESSLKMVRKRKGSGIINGSTKRRRIDNISMEQRVDGVDYISQLPEHIIDQIIGHLRSTKDAARTCILSKRWRNIWDSFSTLVFDQRKFLRRQRVLKSSVSVLTPQMEKRVEMFENYVDETLQRRVERNDASIHKLVLHVTCGHPLLIPSIDRWIDLAIRNNVKELDLHVARLSKKRDYSIPQCVFAARTITVLRVHGCNLGLCDDLNFPNLRKLCLGNLNVNELKIENLVRACPFLEDFRLIYVSQIKVFKVSNLPNLKRIDLHTCSKLKEVDIQAANLETFWYLAGKARCKIDLSKCNKLKSLTLEDAKLEDESFQNHISCFPALENLVLSKCSALKNITISCYKLKTLALRECKLLQGADIDTPNIVSFEYKGGKMMPFTSLNPSSLKEAKLCFKQPGQGKPRFSNEEEHTPWFARLQEFLEKFDYRRGLKLVVRSDKNVVIYEKPKRIFLPRVYDLELDVVKSSVPLGDLLDDILRKWRPVTVSSFSNSKSSLPKLVRKKLIAREKNPGCCAYHAQGNKCWRHFLDNVETVNLVNGRKSEWMGWLRSSRAKSRVKCFRLSWKPLKHVSPRVE